MIVVLSEELFGEERADGAALLTLLRLGHAGRHKVRTRPAYRPDRVGPVALWLSALSRWSPQQRDMAVLALTRGVREAEYQLPDERRERRCLVEPRCTPTWPSTDKDPFRLPLDEALRFLVSPLQILVENGQNDWGFLCKMVPEDWCARFGHACEQGWIEPRNGGGDGQLRNIVERELALNPRARLRTFCLFDSDVRSEADRAVSDNASKKDPKSGSERAQFACEAAGVRYHRLRRRAIENYIPRASLSDWAGRRPREAARVRARLIVDAFYRLPRDEQRHYLHMKEGIAKDRSKDGTLPPQFAGVDGADVALLEQGFERSREDDLAEIWREDAYGVRPADLDSDGTAGERALLFQAIMAEL